MPLSSTRWITTCALQLCAAFSNDVANERLADLGTGTVSSEAYDTAWGESLEALGSTGFKNASLLEPLATSAKADVNDSLAEATVPGLTSAGLTLLVEDELEALRNDCFAEATTPFCG